MSRSNGRNPDIDAMRRAVADFLEAADLDLRGELEATPENVARAWTESYLDGYRSDPADLLKDAYETSSPADAAELVLLKDISFHGMCPHHLLPFHGVAHVAYIPGKKLASLSSLSRLVDCFAHRLEIQETVTRQIALALIAHLDAAGAAVALETDQLCLTSRGASKRGARTQTRHFAGRFADDAGLRSEFLRSVD